ncbi:hypothetical protein GALL_515700 [mine drainage metagenome]|uniref:Uncharacterized protein n=1 Tax=mine drainage metagenome TaxID=410659 RepID=A0A1J5PNJ8_9ZZZZ
MTWYRFRRSVRWRAVLASACDGIPSWSDWWIADAVYPAFSTARIRSLSAAPARIACACSVARLTSADSTPGTRIRARSTRPAQDAQVMPWMAKSAVSGATSYPALATAAAIAATVDVSFTLNRSRTCSVARLTATSSTPGTARMAFSTRLTQDAQVMPLIPRINSSVNCLSDWMCIVVNSFTSPCKIMGEAEDGDSHHRKVKAPCYPAPVFFRLTLPSWEPPCSPR